MINRAAVILKAKQPFIQWIKESDPLNDNPGITEEELINDNTVYLITTDDFENIEQWLSLNFMQLFTSELEEWYTDTSLWPKDRDKNLFDQWFSVEYHSVLIDTVGGLITDDNC